MAGLINFVGGSDNFVNVTEHVGATSHGNVRDDVILVQGMLNLIFAQRTGKFISPLPGGRLLTVDGKVGTETIKCIKHYQSTIQGRAKPDGIVSPARADRSESAAAITWTIIHMNNSAELVLAAEAIDLDVITFLRKSFPGDLARPLDGSIVATP